MIYMCFFTACEVVLCPKLWQRSSQHRHLGMIGWLEEWFVLLLGGREVLSLRQVIFPALILACAKLKYFCTVCITTPKIHSHSTAWSMNFPKFIGLIIFSCCWIHPVSTFISVKPQASQHHIYNSYNSGLHHECNFLKKVNSWPWIDVWDLTWLLIIGLLVPTTTVCSQESGQ